MNAQSDPFANVRLNKSKSEPKPEVRNDQGDKNDPFSNVRIDKSESFPWLYETGRHAARIGSRIAETVGGIPGDVGDLIQSGVFSGLEKLIGHKTSPEAREQAKKYRSPTSKELKKFSQEATGGFTSPQNETEEFIDEFAETASSLLGPMKFRKVLGVSLASNLTKEGLKLAGVGEAGQEAGKLGTMFLATMYNPKGALNYSKLQFQKANGLAKGASINGSQLESNLNSLEKNLQEGLSTTSKNSVMRPLKELKEKITNGKISINELTAAKRDVNELMGEPETLEGAKKLLRVLGKHIDNAIKPYEKINPEFGKAYRPANEIYGAVMQGNKAANFIKKTLGSKSVLGAVAAEVILGHPEAILPTIGAATAAYGGARTVDFFTRLTKSKELQKFYGKALSAAIKEDLPSLRLYSEKIDEMIE